MKQLQHRNIFGRIAKVGEGEGVSKIASLPENGKEGEIYYNTTDKKYYTYTSEGGFSEIGATAMPHGKTPDNTSRTPVYSAEYTLKANTYYNFDDFYTTNLNISPLPVTVHFDGISDSKVANSYVFRITIPLTGTMNMTLNNVTITDSAKDVLDNLEKGHTYEFNIFDGVLMIADITSTE